MTTFSPATLDLFCMLFFFLTFSRRHPGQMFTAKAATHDTLGCKHTPVPLTMVGPNVVHLPRHVSISGSSSSMLPNPGRLVASRRHECPAEPAPRSASPGARGACGVRRKPQILRHLDRVTGDGSTETLIARPAHRVQRGASGNSASFYVDVIYHMHVNGCPYGEG